MKKLLSILLTICLILSLGSVLAGCDHPTVRVDSVMTLSGDFSGERTVTVVYPLSVDIDAVKDTIIATNPAKELESAAFTYRGVEEDGYYFDLTFTFDSHEAYEAAATAVIGRTADAFLSQKNTALTKGVRMTENFTTADLIAWIIRVTADESATRDLGFRYAENIVTIAGQDYSCGESVDVNTLEGSTVNYISIKTSNDKEGHYDRTFVFSIPNETYIASQQALEQYFLTNTAPAAGYYGWSSEGTNMLYTVIYEGLTLDELSEYTGMLLDTDSVSIFYGDKDNSSTPLSEGLAFEETLDAFSFIGPDKGAPVLRYFYSLPTSTIHGDGAVLKNGRWVSEGKWEEGVYQAELTTGSARLRIPDGIQYAINGINFYLESLGDERFRRTTSFLYSKTDGYDGMNYASNFFTAKGARTSTGEDEDNLICSVICEGTAAEITAELVNLFGSGNFMAYRRSSGALSLSVKTTLTDYVSLGSMLNSSNANRPMRYYVSSAGGENIISLTVDGTEIAYAGAGKTSLEIHGGNASVEYRGNIPITSHILIYCLAGGLMLALTLVIVILMLRRRKPKVSPAAQEIIDAAEADEPASGDASGALTQTTTFSIFELGVLSRNKKYVEEINRDIEERLEADRLEARKKELRRKELEEMGRRVYGSDEEASPAEQESAPTQTPMPADEPAPAADPAPLEPITLLEDSDDEAGSL